MNFRFSLSISAKKANWILIESALNLYISLGILAGAHFRQGVLSLVMPKSVVDVNVLFCKMQQNTCSLGFRIVLKSNDFPSFQFLKSQCERFYLRASFAKMLTNVYLIPQCVGQER